MTMIDKLGTAKFIVFHIFKGMIYAPRLIRNYEQATLPIVVKTSL